MPFSPSFWHLPAIFVISWLVDALLQFLPLLLPGVLSLSVSMSKFFSSYKDISHWITAHSNPAWLFLNVIILAKTLFPDKITFTGTGGWDLDIFWGGCYSTHCTPVPWTHCGSGISRLVQESNTGKCLMLGRAEREVLFSCVCWGIRKVPTPLPQPPE